MRKLIAGIVAVLLGALSSVALAESSSDTPMLETADGVHVVIDCPTEIVSSEEFLWGEVPSEGLSPDTPGPIGVDEVTQRVPDAKEIGPHTVVIERSPGKAKFIVELLDDGRVAKATWCTGEDGVGELFPDLAGGDSE